MPDLDVEQVLRRWQIPGSGAPTVAVVGPPGSGRSTLADALASLLPAFRVRDGSDPAASVVVVAFDASAPIGREELGLLAAAAATGSVTIAVVTRIDAHHDWKAVLDRDEAVLAGHARRVVAGPILPVSVSTGLGLPELRTAVERALDDDGGAAPRHVELDRIRAMVRATADDLRRDDATAALRERRAALIADRDGPRTEAAAALRRLSALARVDLTHLVGDRVRAATAALRAEVDRSGRSMSGEFPRRVREEVDVLTTAVDATTDAVLGDLAAAVMGAPHPVAGPNRRPPVVDDPEPRHRGVEDRMMIVVGASAGAGLGRLVVSPMSHIAAFDLVALPVTLLIGGVAAWALTRMRGLAADRAHLRQWLAEAMTQVRSGLEQRALTRLVESEAEIVDAVQRAHRERARTTERALAELDRELRDGVARTSGRLAAVERDLAVLDRALAEHGRPFAEPADRALRPSPQ